MVRHGCRGYEKYELNELTLRRPAREGLFRLFRFFRTEDQGDGRRRSGYQARTGAAPAGWRGFGTRAAVGISNAAGGEHRDVRSSHPGAPGWR